MTWGQRHHDLYNHEHLSPLYHIWGEYFRLIFHYISCSHTMYVYRCCRVPKNLKYFMWKPWTLNTCVSWFIDWITVSCMKGNHHSIWTCCIYFKFIQNILLWRGFFPGRVQCYMVNFTHALLLLKKRKEKMIQNFFLFDGFGRNNAITVSSCQFWVLCVLISD